MIWDQMFEPAWCEKLCRALLHTLWQFGLLLAVSSAVGRLTSVSAARRYAFSLAMFLIGAAAVPVTLVFLASSPGRAVPTDNAALGQRNTVEVSSDSPVVDLAEPTSMDAAASQLVAPTANMVADEPAGEAIALGEWATWMAASYLVGVVLMVARLAFAVAAAQRLGRSGRPLSEPGVSEISEQLWRRFGLATEPVVRVTNDVVVPRVVGLFRPVVLLPTSTVTGLTIDQLHLILAHEVAHLRRHDLWVNLLQRVAEATLFFNPFVWLMSRQISELREFCCDEAACATREASNEDVREDYAVALVRVAELSRSHAFDAERLTALAATGRSPSELRRRVAAVMGEPIREPVRVTRGGLTAVAVAAITMWMLPTNVVGQANRDPDPSEGADQNVIDATGVSAPPISETPTNLDPYIVIADHVILLEGERVMNWKELDVHLGTYADPSKVHPHFYMTHAVIRNQSHYDDTKTALWELHKKYNFGGHSEGSLWPRTSARFDKIKTQDDLQPDDALRVDGTVVDDSGNPVANAEVVVVEPVGDSISYDTYHLAIVNGRVRNHLEHVITRTDEAGRYTVYPPAQSTLIAMHPEHGFRMTPGAYLQNPDYRRVQLSKWAEVTAKPGDTASEPSIDLTTTWEYWDLQANEIVMNQYWDDHRRAAEKTGAESDLVDGVFRYRFVPPMSETTVSLSFDQEDGGSFSMPSVTINLMPGEQRELPVGPLSDVQQAMLESMKKRSAERQASETANE